MASALHCLPPQVRRWQRLSAMLKASSPATRFLAAKCLTQLAPALPSTSTQSYEASLFLSGLQHVSTGPGPLSSGK